METYEVALLLASSLLFCILFAPWPFIPPTWRFISNRWVSRVRKQDCCWDCSPGHPGGIPLLDRAG